MNLSRRNLLLGAVATVVAPVASVAVAPAQWTPQPAQRLPGTEYVGELLYGGARGGGKLSWMARTPLLEAYERIVNPPSFIAFDEASDA